MNNLNLPHIENAYEKLRAAALAAAVTVGAVAAGAALRPGHTSAEGCGPDAIAAAMPFGDSPASVEGASAPTGLLPNVGFGEAARSGQPSEDVSAAILPNAEMSPTSMRTPSDAMVGAQPAGPEMQPPTTLESMVGPMLQQEIDRYAQRGTELQAKIATEPKVQALTNRAFDDLASALNNRQTFEINQTPLGIERVWNIGGIENVGYVRANALYLSCADPNKDAISRSAVQQMTLQVNKPEGGYEVVIAALPAMSASDKAWTITLRPLFQTVMPVMGDGMMPPTSLGGSAETTTTTFEMIQSTISTSVEDDAGGVTWVVHHELPVDTMSPVDNTIVVDDTMPPDSADTSMPDEGATDTTIEVTRPSFGTSLETKEAEKVPNEVALSETTPSVTTTSLSLPATGAPFSGDPNGSNPAIGPNGVPGVGFSALPPVFDPRQYLLDLPKAAGYIEDIIKII